MSAIVHSFVIPVFNEEAGLPELYARLTGSIAEPLTQAGERYEIILVNDGSTDRSEEIIRELHDKDPEHVKLVSFSRNFGHQAAITAGIDVARGQTVTVLDADLQDPPEAILKMIEKWRDGYDVVYGRREKREAETAFKKITAKIFYRMMRSSTQLDIPVDVGDFRLMSRKAATALRGLREKHRFIRGMVSWVGFKQTSVPYVRETRYAGETKYPLRKMVRFAWDGFTGFSLAPLRLATYVGVVSAGVSVIIACWALYVKLFTNRAVQGWTSLIIAILFLGGVQLVTVGVLGEYVGRIFEETKRRPIYIIDHTLGELNLPEAPED